MYTFAAGWWKWWEAINPSWCKRDAGGRLNKEGDGDWGSIAQTGPNGMLNVLICLRWWRDALRGDLGGWEEAPQVVEWALKGIRYAMGITHAGGADYGPGELWSRKRQRNQAWIDVRARTCRTLLRVERGVVVDIYLGCTR
jgi:hypothetical protein